MDLHYREITIDEVEVPLKRFTLELLITKEFLEDVDGHYTFVVDEWENAIPPGWQRSGKLDATFTHVDLASPEKAYADFMVVIVGDISPIVLDESFEE